MNVFDYEKNGVRIYTKNLQITLSNTRWGEEKKRMEKKVHQGTDFDSNAEFHFAGKV